MGQLTIVLVIAAAEDTARHAEHSAAVVQIYRAAVAAAAVGQIVGELQLMEVDGHAAADVKTVVDHASGHTVPIGRCVLGAIQYKIVSNHHRR